jgi:hypothetical protein
MVGSNPDCGSVLCCREKTAGQTKFAGEWGAFGMCDGKKFFNFKSSL